MATPGSLGKLKGRECAEWGRGKLWKLLWLLCPPRCKPNIVGRQCDLCAPGYFHYPECRRCDCHQAGTEASVCDPVTGQCHCKVSPSVPPWAAFLLGSTLLLWLGVAGLCPPGVPEGTGLEKESACVPELQPACPVGWWAQSTLKSSYLLILPGHSLGCHWGRWPV